ncbi:MAG: LysE family transporter [Bacteroidales bacterium]|nr:LysE family transporter [Bacteroidales bacterium]
MEGIIYIIIRGIAVGLLISAPMGPIGVLCIKRTLDRGRWAGFYTGVGAALSDLIYCLLTGLGMSFVTDFIETNRSVLQIIGSGVLLAYAVFLIRSNKKPDGVKAPDTEVVDEAVAEKMESMRKHKNLQDFVTGFFLTFSNPLIIFLIIGLFARFNFLLPEFEYYHYIFGYAAIIFGALGWWLVITRFVDRVRSRFSLATMRTLNVIIGLAILLMSLVGFCTGIMEYLHNTPVYL